jgi:hypothetical protein
MMEKLEYSKRGNLSPEEQLKNSEERKEFYEKYHTQRFNHEQANLGNFERIYPYENTSKMKIYSEILKKAKSMWIESTSGSAKKNTKPKPDPKNAQKKDSSVKKKLVSPFKKIYQTSETAKLKIKQNGVTPLKKSVEKPRIKGMTEREKLLFSEERKFDCGKSRRNLA